MKVKKLLAIALSLCMLYGEASYGVPFIKQSITAQAATSDNGCYSFNATTGELTLSGVVDKDTLSEFKRSINIKTDIKSVVAKNGTVLPENCSYLFSYLENCTSIDLSKADTSNVKKMSFMFSRCYNLTSLNIRNFDTSNVTSMGQMFSYCSNLTSVDVSSFDTSKVTDMVAMFTSSGLTSLDLSGFNTSNVTNMTQMFKNCTKLTSVDVSSFDTSNVTNMIQMFDSCYALTSLDVSGFDTSKVTSMGAMFFNCYNLTTLDVSGFDTGKVTSMGNMFYFCDKLTKLDVSGFDTSNATTTRGMFYFCQSLTTLDVSGFDTSKVTDMREMFYFCNGLTSLDLRRFDTSKVTNMSGMFFYCKNLTTLDVSGFDTSKVTDMREMFYSCHDLTSLDLRRFDTSNVTDLKSMFYGCKDLTSLDLSSFDTSSATNMTDMFKDCKKLKSLTLGINFRNIPEKAALRNGYGWIKRIPKLKHVSGNGEYAVIDNDGYNTYYLFEAYQPTYPTKIKYEYNEQYHQVKFTWNKILLAEKYGILVYLAGKWRIQTQDIPATTTSYTTPENSILSSSTYYVAIAAKVNGKWDTANAIKNYLTIKITKDGLLDSDGDGIPDDEDEFPLTPLTEDEKTVIEFFNSAEKFEIYYLSKFCTRFDATPIQCITYINVFRQYADYDVDGVQQGLKDIGLVCDIDSLKFYYGEYCNYKNGTSWAEIQAHGYEEWYVCYHWFLAEWMWGVSAQLLQDAYKVPKDVEENVKFDFSVFDDTFDVESYIIDNQKRSTTHPSNLKYEPYGAPFSNKKSWGDMGEKQAAEHLAENGYDVEMLPEVYKEVDGKIIGNGYGKDIKTNPDCRIEGKVYDIYSPSTQNLTTIKKEVLKKSRQQTSNVVLNLNNPEKYFDDGTLVSDWQSVDEIVKMFKYNSNNSLNELDELIILYNEEVLYAYVR
ncbi:BspA family leucine-rich repeat surface protein [Ruminococcus albus]|uniref:Lipoprotein n=1 Tax=Ruminococcus albus (strain ATCC 27210 / DSM 20455 / JCM 14654 / NCDO 2250 / 7) TaxID=697329 RepID=E6UHA0_RUMA7|nr:BspA family leucine-rich repeat surface protein [Ruminococcus albus]ADU23178.1 lipoprotein [Ruminococcus albus 7 = DSM 20455]